MRLLEDVDEIVDEDIELQAREPLDLGGQCVLEIDVVDRQRRIRSVDQPGAPQPAARGVTQIGAIRVLMTELGLVADDVNVRAGLPARRQEITHSGKDLRVADSLAIDPALQALPGEFAAGLGPKIVPDLGLEPLPSVGHQPALTCGGGKHLVVADDRVVEIDPDPHAAHFRLMFCIILILK